MVVPPAEGIVIVALLLLVAIGSGILAARLFMAASRPLPGADGAEEDR